MNNKKIFYIIVVMHTLFFITAFVFLKMQKDRNINKYLHEFYKSNKIVFNKEIHLLNNNMDLLEKMLIDKHVLNIIKQAQTNYKLAREELIKIFLPKYNILRENGFYLVHFHLSDGRSFVRFHSLDKFNDYLFNFRPSIKYVQSTKKIFHGFEIGKGIGGFRSVYPLIYNNQIIGSFEISFSIDNLIKYMFQKQHIAMVMDKNLVRTKVFKDELSEFKKCKLNPDYYVWGNGCKLFKNNYHINFDKKINIVEGNVVFSYPIYDMFNKKDGYLLNIFPIKDISVINEIEKNFKNMMIIVAILYVVILLIIIAIYLYLEAKLKAETDHLTQILNRNGCLRKLKYLKTYSLFVIDIDHFKKINDTYGHDKGDYVLSELSKLLNSHIRKEDILCRWGGEEFLVILPNQSAEIAIKVANKLRKLVKKHKFDTIDVTISIGVAMYDGDFESTFKKADDNLYKAKSTGRDKVVY